MLQADKYVIVRFSMRLVGLESNIIYSTVLNAFPEGCEITDWKGVLGLILEQYFSTINRSCLSARNAHFPTELAAIRIYKFEPTPERVERWDSTRNFYLWVETSHRFLRCLEQLHIKNKWHLMQDMLPRNISKDALVKLKRDFVSALKDFSNLEYDDIIYNVWVASLNLLFGCLYDEGTTLDGAVRHVTEKNKLTLMNFIDIPNK